ncbi:MAG: hypothetical protein KatS3mg023_1631 [Armatimonadota bacterium]|nr:MAG: hypothetical protein KatS3mg023_1631 [Armatimonadota bacterium]
MGMVLVGMLLAWDGLYGYRAGLLGKWECVGWLPVVRAR